MVRDCAKGRERLGAINGNQNLANTKKANHQQTSKSFLSLKDGLFCPICVEFAFGKYLSMFSGFRLIKNQLQQQENYLFT